MIETGSHRIPTKPPYEVNEIVRFLGVPQGSAPLMGVPVGALGMVMRNVAGRQASGKVLSKDKQGELKDVTVDGYSVVLFEGGLSVSVTESLAKYFAREGDLTAEMVLR